MHRHILLAALISVALAAPAFGDDLNPQPEPPGRSKMHNIGSQSSGAGAGKANPALIHGFNPQPDPPGKNKPLSQANTLNNAAATHGFNPQPDPPGDTQVQTGATGQH